MDEYQESDVLWEEKGSLAYGAPPQGRYGSNSPDGARANAKESNPIAIPRSAPARRRCQSWELEFARQDEDDIHGRGVEDGDKEMVPPHVLVARRLSEKMAFSVCTGQGRTLKGRDLSQVRNSILRLTGFLEG